MITTHKTDKNSNPTEYTMGKYDAEITNGAIKSSENGL